MVLAFQEKSMISLTGRSCLHWGHLILAIRRNNQKLKLAQSKPIIIPKKRVIKMVSISF